MKQMSVAASEYIKKPKQTRKERFLQEMEAVAGVDTLPDETTILNFRHLLERYGLSKQVFAEVNGLLTEQGLLLREGTTVRCHSDRRSAFHQEPGGQARSGDDADEEGQPMVLRHEGAHWLS